jgi:hypothetical protein
MTPEQLAALKQELERFLTHPLNIKFHLAGQSKHTTAFYLPLPNNPDNDFSASPFPGDFLRDREIPRVYAFRAILLQRLKDALAAEGFVHTLDWTGDEKWSTDERPFARILKVEHRGYGNPELLRLLGAINTSEIWREA